MPHRILRFNDPDLQTEGATVRFQPSGKIIVKMDEGSHYTFHPGKLDGHADVHKSDESFPEGDPRRYETLWTFDKTSIVREVTAIGPEPIIEFASMWRPVSLDWIAQQRLSIGPRLSSDEPDRLAGISVKRGPSDDTVPAWMKPPEFYDEVLDHPNAAYLLFDATTASTEPYGVMIVCGARDGFVRLSWVSMSDLRTWITRWEPVFLEALGRIQPGKRR